MQLISSSLYPIFSCHIRPHPLCLPLFSNHAWTQSPPCCKHHYHPPEQGCHSRYRVDNVFTRCVCLIVCVCVRVFCYDTCPDDLIMKDGCHTNIILQEYSWGCLVVRVRCHTLMILSMTSPGQKGGQISKLPWLDQFLSYSMETNIDIVIICDACDIFLTHSYLVWRSSEVENWKRFRLQ